MMDTEETIFKCLSLNKEYIPYSTIKETDNTVTISLNKQEIISLYLECYSVIPGLCIIENTVKSIERYTQDDYIFDFDKDGILLISYLMKGQCQIPADNDKFMFMKEGEVNIYLNKNNATVFNHINNSKFIHILINKKELMKNDRIKNTLKYSEIIEKIYEIANHKNHITFESSSEIKEVLQQIIKYEDNERLPKYMYNQLKTYELLGLTYASEIENKTVDLPTYSDAQIRVVRKIKNALSRDIASYVSLDVLSASYGINLTTLKNCFRDMYGKPLYTWYREYKFHRAKELIKNTNYPIAKIANMVGYKSSSKFSKAFKKEMGMLPSSYRKNK